MKNYTFEQQIELERQAGKEIGWKLGEKAGRKSGEEVDRKLGEEEKLREQIRKKLRKAKTLDQIAEDLEEEPDDILPLYEQIREELAAGQSNKTRWAAIILLVVA